MNIRKIKDLVLASYTKSVLDEKKVNAIVNMLNRPDLKQYINELKSYESKKNITIAAPFIQNEENKKLYEELFPNKKIIYKQDSSLIAGVKITNNDIIYEFNLKNTFDNIISYIKQSYD